MGEKLGSRWCTLKRAAVFSQLESARTRKRPSCREQSLRERDTLADTCLSISKARDRVTETDREIEI